MFVVETKGAEYVNDPLKLDRLKQWCTDMNNRGAKTKWGFVFVDQAGFERYRPVNFQELIETFTEYQD